MKTDTDTARSSSAQLRPAPSLRVPVTAGNRDYLRWLRAVELTAWETGCTEVLAGPDVFFRTRNAAATTRLRH